MGETFASEQADTPEAASPQRRRPSWLLVAVVVVAAAFAVGASAAALTFRHQRQRDQAGVTAAQSALSVQQTENSAAAERLSATTAAATAFDPAARNLAGLAQQATSDVDQELAVSHLLLTAGLAGNDNGWNTAIGQIGPLVQHETDAATQFESVSSTIPPP